MILEIVGVVILTAVIMALVGMVVYIIVNEIREGINHRGWVKCMEKLTNLEADLTVRAEADYEKNKQLISHCSRCFVAPVHSYDSFGMPMHKLACPKCGQFVEYAKEMAGVIQRWNSAQRIAG